jgi:hypothetical protein
MTRTPSLAFLIVGVVFLTIGASGQRGFIALGTAFIAIGIAFLVRGRRGGRSK